MSEQELKLHVPRQSHHAIERAVQRGASSEIKLRALYFDTPGRELVQARIALRLRLEGEQWVQTLKMPGEHSLSRIELNQNRPDATLDLSLYADTPAAAVFAGLNAPLEICYETDVQRLFRETRTRNGVVEIAFDRGWLRAGALQLPISEIEFELKSGQLAALFALGRTWQRKFGLILDLRSKAERGDRLAQLAQRLGALEAQEVKDEQGLQEQVKQRTQLIADFWAPRSAQAISLNHEARKYDGAQALSLVTEECLEQIVRNAAFLCEIDTAGVCKSATAEHLHQLRVGIRRLRSAWSFFDGITSLPPLEHRQAISRYFAQLGGTRDDDVLRECLLPALEQAGQPELIMSKPVASDTSIELVTGTAFQGWLLDMLELSTAPAQAVSNIAPPRVQHTQPSDQPGDFNFPRAVKEPPLKTLLFKKLNKWHRQILKDGLHFLDLECEQQHALRKKCKRLRYAMQFCEALLESTSAQAFRKQLATTQDILGEMNDLYVAQPVFAALTSTQPQAWFACGWIAARMDTLTHQAAKSFEALAATKPPWN
jgi:triphosphatase